MIESRLRAWVYEIRGRAFSKLGQVPEAISSLEQSLTIEDSQEGKTQLSAYIADLKSKGSFVHKSELFPRPLVRVPPMFPPRANESGHCKAVFDVDKKGMPYNVQTLSCSNMIFAAPTINSIKKWIYNPKLVNGQPVGFEKVKTQVTFKLSDECGNPIPEPKP